VKSRRAGQGAGAFRGGFNAAEGAGRAPRRSRAVFENRRRPDSRVTRTNAPRAAKRLHLWSPPAGHAAPAPIAMRSSAPCTADCHGCAVVPVRLAAVGTARHGLAASDETPAPPFKSCPARARHQPRLAVRRNVRNSTRPPSLSVWTCALSFVFETIPRPPRISPRSSVATIWRSLGAALALMTGEDSRLLRDRFAVALIMIRELSHSPSRSTRVCARHRACGSRWEHHAGAPKLVVFRRMTSPSQEAASSFCFFAERARLNLERPRRRARGPAESTKAMSTPCSSLELGWGPSESPFRRGDVLAKCGPRIAVIDRIRTHLPRAPTTIDNSLPSPAVPETRGRWVDVSGILSAILGSLARSRRRRRGRRQGRSLQRRAVRNALSPTMPGRGSRSDLRRQRGRPHFSPRLEPRLRPSR